MDSRRKLELRKKRPRSSCEKLRNSRICMSTSQENQLENCSWSCCRLNRSGMIRCWSTRRNRRWNKRCRACKKKKMQCKKNAKHIGEKINRSGRDRDATSGNGGRCEGGSMQKRSKKQLAEGNPRLASGRRQTGKQCIPFKCVLHRRNLLAAGRLFAKCRRCQLFTKK